MGKAVITTTRINYMRDLRSSSKRRPGYTEWKLTVDNRVIFTRNSHHFTNRQVFRKWALQTKVLKEMGITEVEIDPNKNIRNLDFPSQSL